MTVPSASVPDKQHAVSIAAFFLPFALVPWLNPFAGGAMTPGIPLLVGWTCTAFLFAGQPAKYLPRSAAVMLGALVLAVLCGVALDRSWQLLAAALLMMGAAALVSMSLVQEFAPLSAAVGALEPGRAGAAAQQGVAQKGISFIAWSWLLAGLINALIGVLQYRQQTAWLGQWVNHAPVGQIYGNLRQRNQFASLLCMALWALWYLWQQGWLAQLLRRFFPAPQGVVTVLAWLLMLPLSAMMAFTSSRTGLLQLAAMVMLLAFWRLRRQQGTGAGTSRAQVIAWLLGVALVYAATSYLLPHLLGGVDMLARLEGTDSRACISRKVLWSNVLQLIAQKPWWGWGWGELDYAHYYANYSGMRFCSLLDHAHNLPLQLAVELGIPLALALCGLCLWWVLRNRPWAETNPARQLMWGVLVVMAVHSMVEYPLWYAHFQLACGLALGVLWSTARSRRTSTTYTGATARYLQGVLAGCLLLGMAYASFDFARVTQLYMAAENRVWPFRDEPRKHAERSFLYRNAVQFASVSTDTITLEQAEQQLAIARRLMHYSPESRIAIRIIECLRVLGRHAEADAEAAHFKQVYPAEYARWHAGAEK